MSDRVYNVRRETKPYTDRDRVQKRRHVSKGKQERVGT